MNVYFKRCCKWLNWNLLWNKVAEKYFQKQKFNMSSQEMKQKLKLNIKIK